MIAVAAMGGRADWMPWIVAILSSLTLLAVGGLVLVWSLRLGARDPAPKGSLVPDDPVADKEMVYRRFYSDIQMYATGPDIDPQQYLSDQLCDAIPTPENHWAGGNIARACNEEYDELYAQLAETEVGAARAELIKRLNDILVQNYYEIPLVNRGAVSAHHNSLKGVQINAWDSELWNLAEWHRQQSD